MNVLALAAETRKAWVLAVAARRSVRYSRPGDAGGRGQRRTGAAHGAGGNFNRLQQAREQSFYADAALGLARAQQAQRARASA